MTTLFRICILIVLGIFFYSSEVMAERAVAAIRGTADGSLVSGEVTFEETEDDLKITADLTNVPPGKHGFHIHEYGSCENEGKAAGVHYNPHSVPHGHLATDGFENAHAGDLGNIDIKSDGTGKLETLIPGLSVSKGQYSVAGRTVIVHEKEDDFGQPTGNAGARTGCGTIAIAA